MNKKRVRDDFSIEWQGNNYRGYRIIEGTRKLFQTIYYKDQKKFDGHSYKPNEGTYMKGIAIIILRELVEETL